MEFCLAARKLWTVQLWPLRLDKGCSVLAGKFGVFSILMRRDSGSRHNDPLLNLALQNTPTPVAGPNQTSVYPPVHLRAPVDLQALLSPYFASHFATYNGSLTYPPCTQGVQWFIFVNVTSINDFQWAAFNRLLVNSSTHLQGNNSRPVRPLNGRKVTWY